MPSLSESFPTIGLLVSGIENCSPNRRSSRRKRFPILLKTRKDFCRRFLAARTRGNRSDYSGQ